MRKKNQPKSYAMYKVIFSSQREEKVSEKGFVRDSCLCLLFFPLPLFPQFSSEN